MTERFDRMTGSSALQEVDRLLHEYYRAELPSPWPARRLPPARVYKLGQRSALRLTLAASVALAFFSFWAVAGLFPMPSAGTLPRGPEIGKNPFGGSKPVAPAGIVPKDDAPPSTPPLPLLGPSDTKGMR